MDSFEILLNELSTKSKLKNEDILNLVDKKYSEMKGLVTKEGAIYLVAKELNVDLAEVPKGRIQIKNIVHGMRNLNIVGRIFRISKVNEFKKSNGGMGKVANIFIGDGTGYIRIPLWDDQVNLLGEHTLNLGDIIQVNNAISRENTYGETEISLGRFGAINHVENFMELPSVEELSKMHFNLLPERSNISNIAIGGNFEIKGTIVYLFKGNFLFGVCSVCNGRLKDNSCTQHGETSPNNELVVSFILDDSTADLRCVVFRELAEKLCDVSSEELSEIDSEQRYNIIKDKVLGKEVILIGRPRKNRMFNRTEMIIDSFKRTNPIEESKRLIDDIRLAIGG